MILRSGVKRLGFLTAAVIALGISVGALIFGLGARDLAQTDDARPAGRWILDDGVLSVDNLVAAGWSGFEEVGEPDEEQPTVPAGTPRCEVARDIYAEIAESQLERTTPALITVPDDAEPTDDGRTCIVNEERRSPRAGISVLLATTLGGVSALIALPAWLVLARRRWPRADVAAGTLITAMIVGVTLLVAGSYRFELHFLVMLAVVAVALVPTVTAMTSAVSASWNDLAVADDDEATLDRLRQRRGDVRAALLALSVLLSLSVALTAALNGRYAAAWGSLQLNVLGFELGGFTADDISTVTAIEGLLFALILVAVALPALVKIDAVGASMFRDLWSGGIVVVDDDAARSEASTAAPPAPLTSRIDRLIARDSAAAGLGFATRPVQWVENVSALVLPIFTGVAADFLGLLG